MPTTPAKNLLYRTALALVKKPSYPAADSTLRVLKRNRVTGGCVQVIRQGALSDLSVCGIRNEQGDPVTADTVFRLASVTKMICAMACLRLENQGALSVDEDAAAVLGIGMSRPLTVRSLLSHTSGIVDTEGRGETLDRVLARTEFCGAPFRYSNLGAGIVGSFLEAKTGKSLETVVREQVLTPCGAKGAFSAWGEASACHRVLPARWTSFRPGEMAAPDPMRHYESGAGSLFMTAGDLARVTLSLMNDGPLLLRMRSLHVPYGVSGFYHGLGLLQVEDSALYPRTLCGHQGFAYGAVNGVFFDPETGDGFVSLNCGAGEARQGRMAVLNRALISSVLGGGT